MKRILFLMFWIAAGWVSLTLSASPALADNAAPASAATKATTVAPATVSHKAVPATAPTAVSTAVPAAETPTLDSLSKRVSGLENAIKVEVHGFAELDAIQDDTHSFAEVVGDGPVLRSGLPSPGVGSYNGNNGETLASMRDSRLSFLGTVPAIDGWKTKGYVEVDFKGYDPSPTYLSAPSNSASPNSESSWYTYPTLGLRHAYVSAEKNGLNIMAGQYWSLFGWNMDYILASVSVAPYMGVLYERTPQIRVSDTLGLGEDVRVQLAVSADRPEQRDSQFPNADGALKFIIGGWKGRFGMATGPVNTVPFSIGVSGTDRNYAWPTAWNNPGNYDLNNYTWAQSLAIDALIPLLPFDGKDGPAVVATGEWTTGTGDGDMFPYWTGGLPALANANNAAVTVGNNTLSPNLDAGIAGFDPSNNFTLIKVQSWNGQVQIHGPKSWGTFLTAGYGEIFSPNIGGLSAWNPAKAGGAGMSAGSYNDDQVMFANIMHDFTSNIRLAVEYARIATNYLKTATAPEQVWLGHRFQVSAWYRF